MEIAPVEWENSIQGDRRRDRSILASQGDRYGGTGVPVLRTVRMVRIDGLHILPRFNPAMPARIYASPVVAELPYSLFPYLFATAKAHGAEAGAELIPTDCVRLNFIVVLSGEVEMQPPGDWQRREASLAGRLLNSDRRQAIALIHVVPRGWTVRARLDSRVLLLDSERIDALRAWMLRCDARRKPARRTSGKRALAR